MRLITLFLIIIPFIFNTVVYSQKTSIEGAWANSLGTEKIEIYRKGDHYFGKIIWLKDSVDKEQHSLKDVHNPDETQKNKPLIGLELLKNLEPAGPNVWRNGTFYDPGSGRTYNCQIALRADNLLDMRKFFGLTLIGRTERWSRVEK